MDGIQHQSFDAKQNPPSKTAAWNWQPLELDGSEIVRIPAGTALNLYFDAIARDENSN